MLPGKDIELSFTLYAMHAPGYPCAGLSMRRAIHGAGPDG